MMAGGKPLRYRDARLRAGRSARRGGIICPPQHGLPGGGVILRQRTLKDRDTIGEVPIVQLDHDATRRGNETVGAPAFAILPGDAAVPAEMGNLAVR